MPKKFSAFERQPLSCIDMEHFTLMNNDLQKKRMFLFLQGPRGPFFLQLVCHLKAMATPPTKLALIRAIKSFRQISEVLFLSRYQSMRGAGSCNENFEKSRSQILRSITPPRIVRAKRIKCSPNCRVGLPSPIRFGVKPGFVRNKLSSAAKFATDRGQWPEPYAQRSALPLSSV